MKPNCYNRPPIADGRWFYTGEYRRGKPVMRWHPRWFEDRCATHDGVGIGPNNENYPAAHGWDCSGCRLDPRPQFAGIDIVEDASIPPGVFVMGNKTESPEGSVIAKFFQVSGDFDFLPDEGRRWHFIDPFEPIQRSIQR